jgi:outer membrane protein
MRKLCLGLIITGLFVFVINSVNAQQKSSLKIGFVDAGTIITGMPEAQAVDKQLKDITTKYQDSLLKMKKEFEDKVAKYQKQKTMMPVDQQQKEEEILQKQQMELYQFQDEKFGQRGELAQKNETLLEPLRKKIKEAIEVVAKEEGMSFILDKSSNVLLYGDDKYDITYKVLDKIKRGKE